MNSIKNIIVVDGVSGLAVGYVGTAQAAETSHQLLNVRRRLLTPLLNTAHRAVRARRSSLSVRRSGVQT